MKLLKDILFKVAIESVKGTTDLKINALHFDSRKVAANDVFFAIPGVVSDGHDFIDKAINQGASVIICERLPELLKEEEVTEDNLVEKVAIYSDITVGSLEKLVLKGKLKLGANVE